MRIGLFIVIVCVSLSMFGIVLGDQSGSGTAEPFYPKNLPYQDTSQNVIETSYQDPGIAEPYYPATPPVPSFAPNQEPVQVEPLPSPSSDPGSAEPYYPTSPPQPAPTEYIPPVDHSYREYYSLPSHESVVVHNWYDYRDYRPPYDEIYDRRWDWYSYSDGILKISSTPYQAEVYLDNRFRGYTPYSGYLTLENIRPGTYTVRLKYAGYYDYSEDVYVSRGRTTYVDANLVKMGERYQNAGSISVQSEPSGASVYLDNAYRGITPVVLAGVSSGDHSLLVRQSGYFDYVCRIEVKDKQTVNISAVMSQVQITSSPTPITSAQPVQAPVPSPTKSGMCGWIVCIALLVSAVFVFKYNRDS